MISEINISIIAIQHYSGNNRSNDDNYLFHRKQIGLYGGKNMQCTIQILQVLLHCYYINNKK